MHKHNTRPHAARFVSHPQASRKPTASTVVHSAFHQLRGVMTSRAINWFRALLAECCQAASRRHAREPWRVIVVDPVRSRKCQQTINSRAACTYVDVRRRSHARTQSNAARARFGKCESRLTVVIALECVNHLWNRRRRTRRGGGEVILGYDANELQVEHVQCAHRKQCTVYYCPELRSPAISNIHLLRTCRIVIFFFGDDKLSESHTRHQSRRCDRFAVNRSWEKNLYGCITLMRRTLVNVNATELITA